MKEVKNKGGQPRKYKDGASMQNKIDEYFAYCDSLKEVTITKNGNKSYRYKPYTVSGLALYLGIHKDTLLEYQKDPKYSVTIKNAKLRIDNFLVEHLLTQDFNTAGVIFILKNNFGYKEADEHKMSIDQAQLKIAREKLKIDREKLENDKFETWLEKHEQEAYAELKRIYESKNKKDSDKSN